MSLERIGELLAGNEGELPPPRPRSPGMVEIWSHIVVADGLEITLEPGRANLSPEQVRAFVREAGALYRRIVEQGEK